MQHCFYGELPISEVEFWTFYIDYFDLENDGIEEQKILKIIDTSTETSTVLKIITSFTEI